MQDYFTNSYFSLTLYWRGQLIRKVTLGPGGSNRSFTDYGAGTYSDTVAGAVARYENKEKVVWDDPPLDWTLITSSFQKHVLQTLMKNIAFGKTVSYGKLAQMSGYPGAARAVGRALSGNPWPVIVPCHRVLTSSGELGGFSSGLNMKKTLLSLEGLAC